MTDFILNGLLWTLALYGLIEIVKTLIYIFTYTDLKSDGVYLIIAAKNQENKIEGILRSIFFRLCYEKETNFKNIIVTDLDSTDNTLEIISKMNREYDFIKANNWNECKDIIDNIEGS